MSWALCFVFSCSSLPSPRLWAGGLRLALTSLTQVCWIPKRLYHQGRRRDLVSWRVQVGLSTMEAPSVVVRSLVSALGCPSHLILAMCTRISAVVSGWCTWVNWWRWIAKALHTLHRRVCPSLLASGPQRPVTEIASPSSLRLALLPFSYPLLLPVW